MGYTLPDAIQVDRHTCNNLSDAEQREWWLSDGKGGYAGGTIAGTLTRRYHGLLIVPLNDSLERHLILAKADVELVEDDRVIPLHTNRWRSGAITPTGHLSIESFKLHGNMPVWHYRLDDMLIEARIWMAHGQHSTYLAWHLLENPSQRKVQLRARLLINERDHHGSREDCLNASAIETKQAGENGLDVLLSGGHVLHFDSRCSCVEPANFCVHDFDLPVERERGLSDRDHHLCVGHITFPLYLGHQVGMVATLETDVSPYVTTAMQTCLAHQTQLLAHTKNMIPEFTKTPPWIDQLILAADSFLFEIEHKNMKRAAIIAGFPWFGEWGRDSMIALPGLLIATGRYRLAKEVLLGYLPLVDGGMLPNNFPADGDAPQYNTVDAALWYIEAWCVYMQATQDLHSIKEAWPVLREIVRHYRDGTRFGIRMDTADGLLCAGEAGVQLTWMDAKVGDTVITPRIGKPVEINALWYNALMTLAQIAEQLHDTEESEKYLSMAEKTRRGFRRFIKDADGGLFDVLDGPNGHDGSLRPNQIFAVSLPHCALDEATQRAVVNTCQQHLLTPYGLRTLNREHPDYRARYEGGVWQRDSAYHQGTVWPWLLGHYALAEYRVSGDAATALQHLDPLRAHLLEAGLGTISEILDAEPPHTPRGCPSQAWSVACVLEVWWKLHRAQHTDTHKETKDETLQAS